MPWESADEQGMLPLHHAVQHNMHVDAVQLLIDEAGGPAALSEKTEHGLLPIHLAARSNTSPEVITFLIEEGGRDTLDVRDHAGKLPLHHAAECNTSPAAFRVLLFEGGLGALVSSQATTLLLVVSGSILRDCLCCQRVRDVHNRVPIQLAARENTQHEILALLSQPFQLLKEHEAQCAAEQMQQLVAVHTAIESTDAERLAAALGSEKTSREVVTAQVGGKPMALHRAIRKGSLELFGLLLRDFAADEKVTVLNLQDHASGYTALHMAVAFGRPALVDAVIKAGCDTQVTSNLPLLVFLGSSLRDCL